MALRNTSIKLLNCWCVHTGIANADFSVAMIKSHGSLHPVNRRGTVRGYRLIFGSTYHSFHATLAKGHKARLEAEAAMALQISHDKAIPPIHVQGLLLRFNKRKRETYLPRKQKSQQGSDTKVYLGSNSEMKYVASKVASANGPRRVCMQAPEVHA